MNRKPRNEKGPFWPADLFAVPPRQDPPVPEDAGMPADPFGAEFLAEQERIREDFLASLKPLELQPMKPLTLDLDEFPLLDLEPLELLPMEPMDLRIDPEPLRLVRDSLDRLASDTPPDAPGNLEDKE